MRHFRVMALAAVVVGGLVMGLSQAAPTFADGGVANTCFESNCATVICNPTGDIAITSGFHGVALAQACGLSTSFHNTAVANATFGGIAVSTACLSGTAKSSAFGGATSLAAACGASNVIGSGSLAAVDATGGGRGGAIASHPNSQDFNSGVLGGGLVFPEQALAAAGNGGYANATPLNVNCSPGGTGQSVAVASGQFTGTQACIGGFNLVIN